MSIFSLNNDEEFSQPGLSDRIRIPRPLSNIFLCFSLKRPRKVIKLTELGYKSYKTFSFREILFISYKKMFINRFFVIFPDFSSC